MKYPLYETVDCDSSGSSPITLCSMIGRRYDRTYSTVQDLAKKALGSFYEPLQKFYLDIFLSSEYQYVVFVARRSIALAELFYIILWHENTAPSIRRVLEESWRSATTDSTIMSYCDEIAQQAASGDYPKILVVDDVVIQGNGMNELLTGIEERVTQKLDEKIRPGEDAGKYWQGIVENLRIRVFGQNAAASAIKLRYHLKLKPEMKLVPRQWRDLSNRISEMITATGLANATFIMGVELQENLVDQYILKKGLCLDANTLIHPQTEHPGSFRERNYLGWANTGQGMPKYYCSIRLLRNRNTEKYRLMPFVFLPQLTPVSYKRMKTAVFQKWGLNGDNCKLLHSDGTSRLEYEAIVLHLSESLLYAWTKAANVSLTPDDFDPMKIALNYGVNRRIPKLSDSMFIRLMQPQYLFGWEELILLLDEVTQDAAPLYGEFSGMAKTDAQCKTEMENIVYQMKIQELTETYRRASSMPPMNSHVLGFSLKDNRISNWNILLSDFLAYASKFATADNACSLINHLLTFMDQGIVTLKARWSDKHYTQVLRMGEQSMFIWPKRYARYHSVLSYLEERKKRLGSNIQEDLNGLLTYAISTGILNTEKTANALTLELMDYLESLNQSGQTLMDWDISFDQTIVSNTGNPKTADIIRQFNNEEQRKMLEEMRIRKMLFNACYTLYPL